MLADQDIDEIDARQEEKNKQENKHRVLRLTNLRLIVINHVTQKQSGSENDPLFILMPEVFVHAQTLSDTKQK